MNLKRRLSVILILGLCFAGQGLFGLGEEEFIKTDPNVYRTGLIMMNPEMDSQAVEGSRYLQIHNFAGPRARITASHFNYDYLPPVNSQGSQGSCVAWAVGYYYKTYQENQENNRTGSSERSNPDNICSPSYIYNLIHVKGDNGAYYSDAFRVINDLGVPSLTDMPYNHNDYLTWPDENDFDAAIPNRTETTGGEYYYLLLNSDTQLDQLKTMLDNGKLAVFGIYVFSNFDNIGSYENIYTVYDKSGISRGGHAQTIVGYDDDLVTNDGVGAFRVVNSWGTGWGDSGYYWISYTAIKSDSDISKGYIYWVDDKIGYSSDKKAVFCFSHDYSRETTTWVNVGGASKYFFDFSVRSSDREYNAFPASNIVLDLKDMAGYLTPGEELRLYMSDYSSNSKAGVIESFSYEDDTLGVNLSSHDTPVAVPDGGQDYAGITITDPNVPEITLNKSSLTFAAYAGGSDPADREFSISNTGIGTMNWTVSDNRSWLSCSPASGTGDAAITVSVVPAGLSGGSYVATITVSSATASNSPQTVSVTLNIYAAGSDAAPFGKFQTPVDGTTVSGQVAVTGWALDDVEVIRVQIKRSSHAEDPPVVIGVDGLVFIGDGVFVKGARPDVEAAYPHYPDNDRAGWGYMMLTNRLPNSGNGTFTLHAFAYDGSGHKRELGQKVIICDNANRIKPFGTIDTPTQGGLASGKKFANFGWALTPQPKFIPGGSTIWVWIDGQPVGHPDYGNYRSDIAYKFPGYQNSNGAGGFFIIDTTAYANGVHTISWSVEDNQGSSDGVGGRKFEIQNLGGAVTVLEPLHFLEDTSGSLKIAVSGWEKGYRKTRGQGKDSEQLAGGSWQERQENQESQERQELQKLQEKQGKQIELEEVERVEIHFKTEGGSSLIGWGRDKTRPLPEGSFLDKENSIFYWQPPPGFLGRYELNFAVTDGLSRSTPVKVVVKIVPKRYKKFN